MPGWLSRHETWAQQTRLNLSPTGRVTLFPSVLEKRAISHRGKGKGLPRCWMQPWEEALPHL